MENITISLSGAAWITLFLGIMIGAVGGMAIGLWLDLKQTSDELKDARFWTGWHKGWDGGYNAAKNPHPVEASKKSCYQCKHSECPTSEEPCRTCISIGACDHVYRTKFEPIEESEAKE